VHQKIVNDEASARIVGKSDSEAAKSLVEELNEIIVSDPGSESVIENFYLALLNCYEKSQNVWCRTMATSRLQPAVMAELKQLDVNHHDLPIVLQRLPSVQLVLQSASQLKYVLGLRGPIGGSATDLKQIIRQGMNEKHGFSVSDLVLGLLLTPSLGRYVTLLLPYCCCNPLEVYKLLLHLQHNWTKLANHFGYSQNEIDDIGAGGNDIPNQIQLFLRVWWMPDCGENKTCAFLQRVIQEKLHLPAMDDGQALLKACLNNDWRKAETLIRSGCHLGARCEDARTPLMHACRKGQDTLVQLLIDKGADPQVMDKRGDACLHFPETLRNRTILECILKEYQRLGVSVDVESLYSECSPLSIACKHLAVNSAELLLTYGADPNGCKNGKHRPLVEASAQGHVGLVRALLKWRPDVNATNKDGFTPLLQACTSNQWGVAQLLMDEGADVNKCGIDCTSPLFAAVSANSLPIAEKLIRKGAIIDAVRFQPGAVEGIVEMTPLSHAAGKGMNSMVELLIKNGANVNYLCSETMPALGFAIIGEQFETFHLLLQCENLDKSITGLSTSIITSVRTEKLYFTEHLLDVLGGPKTALMRAQQTQMELLVENILMYMQATNHPHLSEVGSMPGQYKAPPVAPTPQVRLHPEDQQKIDEVLTHFSRICMSAVLESPEIPVSLLTLCTGCNIIHCSPA
jgi:ankyrin repeat protein